MPTLVVKDSAPLLKFLSDHLHGYKKTTVKNLLKFGSVFVNSKPVTQFDHLLMPGDRIEIGSSKHHPGKAKPLFDFKIIYEDDAVLVVDKPAGILTIATDKIKVRTLYYQLNEYLKASSPTREKQLFIVHRLDKEVSGLIIFAKTYFAKDQLQRHWQDVEKIYYAVVEGHPKPPDGTVRSFLSENKFLKVYSGPRTPNSQLAVTHYRTLKTTPTHTLVEIVLETGRKHQIRVHLSDLKTPIVGDEKYGADEKVPKEKPFDARRLALHAGKLFFTHPLSGKKMAFESALPAVFQDLMKEPQ